MYQDIANTLSSAKKITVLSGAGISTASGLMDFRSNGGLWDGKDPYEISNPSQVGTTAFLQFFRDRILEFDSHRPNDAHAIIYKWQRDDSKDVRVITQNIDGYHRFDDVEPPIELHGHMRHLECDKCGTVYDLSKYTHFEDDACETCDGTVRPPVVLFGEDLDTVKWGSATNHVIMSDALVVIGTSLEVAPFNQLVDIALSMGCPVILITKGDTPYDDKVTYRLRDDIVEELKRIEVFRS